MTWPTHAALGISVLWILSPFPPGFIEVDFGVLAGFAALGALLPDLDASESKIKHLRLLGTNIKPFFLPAQVVYRSDQHRGLLHSLIGWALVAFISIPLAVCVGWIPWLALLLGYGSHLVADAATKTGIVLVYPLKQRFYLLPKGWRITTGSQAEEVCFVLLGFCSLFLLLRTFV